MDSNQGISTYTAPDILDDSIAKYQLLDDSGWDLKLLSELGGCSSQRRLKNGRRVESLSGGVGIATMTKGDTSKNGLKGDGFMSNL